MLRLRDYQREGWPQKGSISIAEQTSIELIISSYHPARSPMVPYLLSSECHIFLIHFQSLNLSHSHGFWLSPAGFLCAQNSIWFSLISLSHVDLIIQQEKRTGRGKGEFFPFPTGGMLHHSHISEDLFKYGHSRNVVFGGGLRMQVIWKARHIIWQVGRGRIGAAMAWENLGSRKVVEGILE